MSLRQRTRADGWQDGALAGLRHVLVREELPVEEEQDLLLRQQLCDDLADGGIYKRP